jgi:hypothetical protein
VAAAAAVVLLAVAALWLPWWATGPDTYRFDGAELTETAGWRGFEVLGAFAVALILVAALVVAAVLATRLLSGAGSVSVAWWVLAAAGVVVATVAVAGIVHWGLSPGAAVSLCCGVLVLAAASHGLMAPRAGFARLVPGVVVLLAVPAWFGAAGTARDVPPASAEFEKIIDYDGVEFAVPGGGRIVRAELGPTSLVPVNDGVGLATTAGMIAMGDDEPFLMVRTTTGRDVEMLGVAGDHLAVADPGGPVRILRLGAPGPPAVVTGVVSAGSLAANGDLVVTRDSAARRVRITTLEPGERRAPVTVNPPNPPVDGFAPDSDVTVHPETGRLAWIDRPRWGTRLLVDGTVVAGGGDPACGPAVRGADAYLPRISRIAPARGGWWLTEERPEGFQLYRLGADGELRIGPAATFGSGHSLLADADGTLYVDSENGVYRLRDPEATLRPLPAPPADCATDLEVAGPPRLTPLPQRAGQLVHIDGTRVLARPSGEVVSFDAAGTERLVGRWTGIELPVEFVSDGAGGVWWLERFPAGAPVSDETAPGSLPEDTLRLVHVSVAGVSQPGARVPDFETVGLHPNFAGSQPLVDDCFAFTPGSFDTPMPVYLTSCDAVVVGPDGQGWVVGGERLSSYRAGDPAPTPRIMAADPATSSVATQLARGVPATELGLHEPQLGLDSTGQALVLSEDMLLAVTPTGEVTALAQDERLRRATLVPVEGGTAVLIDGEPYRLDY